MIAQGFDVTSVWLWLPLGLLALTIASAVTWRQLSPAARLLREQRRLHGKLASVNGLTDGEAAALWRLARAAKLSEPVIAFVRPSLIDSGGLEGVRGEVLASLRQKLFAR